MRGFRTSAAGDDIFPPSSSIVQAGSGDPAPRLDFRRAPMRIVAAHAYSGAAKRVARQLKDPTNDAALDKAAVEMANALPRRLLPVVLVPTPSSSGLNRASAELARRIAHVLGNEKAKALEAVVRTRSVPSSYLRRKAGLAGLSVEDHLASMAMAKDEGKAYFDLRRHGFRPVIVDNVISSGATARAVIEVLGGPSEGAVVLVYADARRGKRGNPTPVVRPLRVCIAGSRDFRRLEYIRSVVCGLPPGTTVVHGGAHGVDREADRVALGIGYPVEVHLARWDKFGRKAGPMRNREMVPSCDFLYAFWDGSSRGTANAIQVAKKAGIPYEVILQSEL
jgi:hypothetical protein